MLTVEVTFFGWFKNVVSSGRHALQVPPGTTLKHFRSMLTADLIQKDLSTTDLNRLEALLQLSAFANDSQILSETDTLTHNCQIAILPPVCGG
jgi:molybdopterin converting factor small subunit